MPHGPFSASPRTNQLKSHRGPHIVASIEAPDFLSLRLSITAIAWQPVDNVVGDLAIISDSVIMQQTVNCKVIALLAQYR